MAGLLAGLGPASTYAVSMRVLAKKPFEIPYEGNESTRTARKAIDQDIGDIELKVRSLKKARNQLASISVVPPEVLSKIFIYIRDSSVDLYAYRQYSTYWIRSVGHICHHWREVALNCATLWSAPIFTHPELVQEMMRRSKKAALTIQSTTGSWTPRILNEIENAMTQLFRIRVLRLSCSSHSDRLHNLFAAFSQPAPHLEQLMLTNTVHSQLGNPYLLPDNAFADAPRLRSVELDRLNFSWTFAIFKHNLTTLKVKSSSAQHTSTFTQLFEALGHMPNLQTLTLVQCIPSHTTVNGHEPTLDFPALRSLELDSRVADCVQFLRHIKYPPHTHINFSCTSLTKANDYTDVFALVGESLRESGTDCSSRAFLSAKLMLDYDRNLSIYLFARPNVIVRTGYYPIGPPDDFDVCLRFDSNEAVGWSFDNVLRELHRLIDLKSLEDIAFDWLPSDRGIESIRETIGKLPKLKTFRVGAPSAQVCRAIHYNSDLVSTTERGGQGRTRRQKKQFNPPPVTVFPALKTLCLQGMDLNDIRSPGTLDILINTLIHRSNMNAPIEELSLEDCRGVRIEQKRLLGELVVDLLVDGEMIEVLELDSDYEDDTYGEDDEDEEDMYDDDGIYFDGHGMYDYDFDLDDAFGWYPF